MVEAQTYIHRPFNRPRESFPRLPNDLVDLDVYLKYIVDNPEDTPLAVIGGAHGFINQHFYFQKRFYRQEGVSEFLKDQVLADFCNSPYNQVVMRRAQEEELHKRFEEHVFAPSPESMKATLADFKMLDILGGAAMGRRVALVPEALGHLAGGVRYANFSKQAPDLSPNERAAFFDQQLETVLQALESPQIISQGIVTGAVRRIGRLINSEVLDEAVQRRIRENEEYLPLRLRHPDFYYHISKDLLKGTVMVEPLAQPEGATVTALQTGVDQVELVA
jgi:hypothetical protein